MAYKLLTKDVNKMKYFIRINDVDDLLPKKLSLTTSQRMEL